MHWEYHPYVLPLAIATAAALAIAFLAWSRRGAPGAVPLAVMMLAVAGWGLAATLEVGSAGLEAKVFWVNCVYIGVVVVPAAWLAFALQYTGREEVLTRRLLALLCIEPLAIVILAWTNDAHGLFRSSVSLERVGSFSALSVEFGVAFWIHAVYSYLLLLIGLLLLIQAFIHAPRLYRGQTGTMLVGALVPWFANALHISGLNPFPLLDPTPFAFTLTGVAMAWGLFRYQLLNVVPVARNAVIEGMSDGIIVLDAQNRVVDVNPAVQRLVGRSASDMIGKPASQVFSNRPDLLDRYRGLTKAREELVMGEGDAQRTYDLRISSMYTRRGRLTGQLVVLRDVTEQKRVEQELAKARDQALEASRLKTELLANVSHDLRTPLNAILGFSDMLQSGVYGSLTDKQSRAAGRVVANSKQLMSLINDLLDQAQVEAGSLQLMNVPVHLHELVEDVRAMMSTQAQVQGLAFDTEITDDVPPVVSGDPQRLRQILVNLVSNAFKFTEQGAVHVCVFRPDTAHWALQVSDTGCGIPEDAQEYIFAPFRKVDGSPTRSHKGVGLGLSLVQRLVDMMDGQISLHSQVDAGSTFTVVLPLTLAQEEQS